MEKSIQHEELNVPSLSCRLRGQRRDPGPGDTANGDTVS